MAKQENIDIITLGQVTPIIDNLDSTRTDAALSANMGKKLNDEKYLIKYIDVGNMTTSTDILIFAASADSGFYRSTNSANKFANLPNAVSSNAFTLEIQSINTTHKTLLLSPYNSEDIFVNTYINNNWLGWELIEQRIKYQEIGNLETETDILILAKTLKPGFYRSSKTANKWLNLPSSVSNSFELTIESISDTAPYRTLILKPYNSNNIYMNTLNYDGNKDTWLGWSQFINDLNPKNIIYRKTIENKEQFDAINLNENGIYYIKNFNTIFPDNGIKPGPLNYGYLEVITHTSNEAFLTYTPYKILNGAKLVTRANNGILENWTYENNFQTSNKGSVNMYGVGDGTDNKISFYDYKTGTVNCSVFDGTAHVNYNGVVITNNKADTYFTLENDKNISFTVDNNKMPIMLNPFIYKNEYTYITGSQNTINKAGIRGGIERWYVDGDGGGKPIGTPMGTSHIISTYTALPDWWVQTAIDFQSGQLQTRASNGNSDNPSQWATLFSTENSKVVTIGNYGETGYVIFANGLILQWGIIVITPDATTYQQYVNLNIPYTTNFNVFCERSYSNHSPANLQFIVWKSGIAQFRIFIETTKLNLSDTYYWFTIGI